jgi:hypothetical protein
MGWLEWEDPYSHLPHFLIFKECVVDFNNNHTLISVTGGGREWLRGVCLSFRRTVEVLFPFFCKIM